MRVIARSMAMLCLLISLWSAIRIANFTVFDVLTPFCILFLLLVPAHEPVARDKDLHLIVESQLLFIVAAGVSTIQSAALAEHLGKAAVISVAMIAMFVMATLIARKKIMTLNEAILCLALSAAISSSFVVLQGQFRLFTSISPAFAIGEQEWRRATGLAEHPIEAGAIAGVGMVLAVYLLLNRSPATKGPITTLILLLFLAVEAYSMVFSASLTAAGSIAAALGLQLLLSRRYGLLAIAGAAIPAALLPFLLAPSTLLGDRILKLLSMGDGFTTVQTRQVQLSETLSLIDLPSFVLGRGYSFDDLPQGLEIHNALIASVFHFGILGLIGQLLICTFLLKKTLSHYPSSIRGALLGVLIVFFGEYLTGPVFSRRSDWISSVIIASFLPAVFSRKGEAGGMSKFPRSPTSPAGLIHGRTGAPSRLRSDGAGTCES